MPGRVAEEVLEEIRLTVFRALAATGRLPKADMLAQLAGSEARATEAIHQLADRRAWALDGDGAIVLAHPFATRSFGYSVMSATTLWWGAIPHLVPDCGPVVIAGLCPACDRALAWRVAKCAPPHGSERAHFLVPASHMWDDVIATCSNQLLFCDDGCIDVWLDRTGNVEGYRMDVETLWRFASDWYAGRLDRGYRRREPADALAYFREVGLTGAFWGLTDEAGT